MSDQEAQVERVELDLDEGLARWLRGCAQRRGQTVAEVVEAQLVELREADRRAEVEALLDDAEAERIAAGCP